MAACILLFAFAFPLLFWHSHPLHLLAKRFGQIIDFAEMMQPHYAYNAAAITIVQNSQKT